MPEFLLFVIKGVFVPQFENLSFKQPYLSLFHDMIEWR